MSGKWYNEASTVTFWAFLYNVLFICVFNWIYCYFKYNFLILKTSHMRQTKIIKSIIWNLTENI